MNDAGDAKREKAWNSWCLEKKIEILDKPKSGACVMKDSASLWSQGNNNLQN